MGNRGFKFVEANGRKVTYEGMGNGKRVEVELPVSEPQDETATSMGLVIEAMAKAEANG